MITPMKKVSIVCMKEDREKVLSELQHSSLIMFTRADTGVSGSDRDSGAYQRRIDALLKELNKYSKKKGMFEELHEISADEFDNVSEDSLEEMTELEKMLRSKETLESEISDTTARLTELRKWESFTKDLSTLGERDYTKTILIRLPEANLEKIEGNPHVALEVLEKKDKTATLVLSFLKSEPEILSFVRELNCEEANLPIKEGKILDEIEKSELILKEKCSERNTLLEGIREFADKSKLNLEILFDQERAMAERSEIRLPETIETVVFEGWVRSESLSELEKVLKKATDVFDIEARDPLENEDVPTALTNNKLVSQFEGITDMFNSPRYGYFDPHAFMAPWYWIIFGMMMGDAGYGLMMAVLIFIAKKIMKPKGGTLKLMNVLLYSSVTTIIFGVLFGSYFGEELLPAVIGFTALDDPISMLILTLVVGVLHIFTGMITKMYIDIRNGRVLDAFFDQFSWMMIIAGLGMIFIPPLSKVGPIIAIIGAAIVLFTAGRKKKGVVGKLVGGLGGLYNITSYFSDILSYSRILALSLATGVVGMVMNLLAGMVQGSVIGFILSLVIYIVGHVFNLVLGLLSASGHSCRLQYIVFYGKFYEGGGKLFKPFSIKTNYINIKKD